MNALMASHLNWSQCFPFQCQTTPLFIPSEQIFIKLAGRKHSILLLYLGSSARACGWVTQGSSHLTQQSSGSSISQWALWSCKLCYLEWSEHSTGGQGPFTANFLALTGGMPPPSIKQPNTLATMLLWSWP